MKPIIVTEQINAPIDRVFALFTNLEQAAEHISGIDSLEMLTDGSMQVGTRWRETRTFYGKQATEEMEITEFEPNDHYTAIAESHGARYLSTFRFTPQGDATEVTMVFSGTPVTLLTKLMAPLFGFMTKGIVKCIEQDLADLKQVAEADAVPDSPPTEEV